MQPDPIRFASATAALEATPFGVRVNIVAPEGQRGTGQIRGKVKEDKIGIGIAGARSLSSEPGKGGGVANNRANPESRRFSAKKRDRRPAQNDKPGAKYRAGRSGEKPNRGGS
jgi:hypothetical protein